MSLNRATLEDTDVKGKRVLMRVDFNVSSPLPRRRACNSLRS